ncbi:hypothetical protein F3Y22_tig00110788pilonHSYRG00448 [Hibiscus syriacus]|uniref:Uncharacterized protein n=1 Tax=Hibiscus syriacus TaxID=106335 RepID=A0A6A2ZRE7_HIBSY|nr:hypothetical protein F3Y22_tig00110788pilonHSYRG00448 [Hibiscus syriacus]
MAVYCYSQAIRRRIWTGQRRLSPLFPAMVEPVRGLGYPSLSFPPHPHYFPLLALRRLLRGRRFFALWLLPRRTLRLFR